MLADSKTNTTRFQQKRTDPMAHWWLQNNKKKISKPVSTRPTVLLDQNRRMWRPKVTFYLSHPSIHFHSSIWPLFCQELGYWQTLARLNESGRERCTGLESFRDLFKGFRMGWMGTRTGLTALYPTSAETGFSSDHMMNSHQTGPEQMWPTPNWATPTGFASASSLHINVLSWLPVTWSLCLFVQKHCRQKMRFIAILT